jgi:outer membrane protein assembly factor BamB
MLALETGQIWWAHELSSYRGMNMDDEALYISTAEGEVVALRARTGAEIWRQSVLLHRGLSEPANMNDALVVGDFQGYLHWLDKSSGALAARVSTGKVRISNVPVVAGNIVVAVNDRGQIHAYRVSPLGGAGKKATAQTPAPASTESQ